MAIDIGASQLGKFHRFRNLHERPGIFVMPNPWNAGAAKILTSLGFEALATISAGLGFAIGRRDSTGSITRDEILTNAREIVEATDLPVSGDLEDGFGSEPEVCARTIELAVEVGLVGGSIEDASGNPGAPIFSFNHAVERIAAASEAASPLPFLLTARAENYLHGRPDLDDTIRRLQAFAQAGADCLYAPGLSDLATIQTVCAEIDKPLNIVMGLSCSHLTVEDLRGVGVKRISVGGAFACAAMAGGMMDIRPNIERR